MAAGGVVGAALRLAAVGDGAAAPGRVLAVNLAGSALLGIVVGRWARPGAAPRVSGMPAPVEGVAAGLCGALTTFSTFAVGAVALAVRDGRPASAAAYVALTVAGSVAAVAAGARLGSVAVPGRPGA